MQRLRLASLLWDRVPEDQARASLRTALSDIQAIFAASGLAVLGMDRESIIFDASRCWIDVRALTEQLLSGSGAAEHDMADTLSRPVLEDLDGVSAAFDQWLAAERARIEAELRELNEGVLHRLSEGGAAPAERARAARRLLSLDPVHEGGWRTLMRALADLGDRAQALREFERCTALLRDRLDIAPSAETRAVALAIRLSAAPVSIAQPPPTLTVPATPLDRRLRVGVLPFVSLSSNADAVLPVALAQEAAAALARFRWFDVIAPVALGEVRRERYWPEALARLGLDYAVDGTLTETQGRLHLTVFLLDLAQLARPVWSERFEMPASALGELYERITLRLVARIDPAILFIEARRLDRAAPAPTLSVIRAIPLIYSMERPRFEEARRLLADALAREPGNAMAAAWSAFSHVFEVGQGWSADAQASYREAERLCQVATRADPDNAEALAIQGHMTAFLHHDFDTAIEHFDRALTLNPSLAFAWALSAPTHCYVGQPEEALARLARYRELAPADPHFRLFETIYTVAYLFAGDIERAVTVGRRSVKANPAFTNGYKPLIAALGLARRREEAAGFLRDLLLLEPGFTVSGFARAYPFRREADRDRYLAGLRAAGVPEI